jgi:hypothetical protein
LKRSVLISGPCGHLLSGDNLPEGALNLEYSQEP